MLRTHENSVSTHSMKYIWYSPQKSKYPLFILSILDIYPRDYRKKNRLSWNDEQLIVYDTVEKYSGYEYVGFIDYDEFLIPTRNLTLKQMIVSKILTLKAPPIICSRRQFQILLVFV